MPMAALSANPMTSLISDTTMTEDRLPPVNRVPRSPKALAADGYTGLAASWDDTCQTASARIRPIRPSPQRRSGPEGPSSRRDAVAGTGPGSFIKRPEVVTAVRLPPGRLRPGPGRPSAACAAGPP
jgi:hypothetical protein